MSKMLKINISNQILLGIFICALMVSKQMSGAVMGAIVLYSVALCASVKDYSFTELFRNYGKITWLWFVWLVWIFMGYIVNNNLGLRQINEILDFRWILGLYAVAFLLKKTTFHKLFFFILAPIMFVIYMIDIKEYFTREGYRPDEFVRVMGYFENPNDLAHSNLVLGLVLFGITLMLFDRKRKAFGLVAVLTLLSFAASYLTFTRSAWLGMAVGGVILFFGIFGKKAIPAFLAVVALFVLCFAFDVVQLRERISYTFTKNNSTSERVVLWDTNFKIFKENPIFGIGYYENVRQLPHYYEKYGVPADQFKAHAHNQYINFLSGTGLVGLLLYLAIWGWFLLQNVKALYSPGVQKWLLWTCFGIQIGFLLAGVAECNFEMSLARSMLLIIWAFVFHSSRSEELYKMT